MVKIEIKPVYNPQSSLQKEHDIPIYLLKTVRIFGILIYRKKVLPMVWEFKKGIEQPSAEFMCKI
jgi:hypothetical protein